MTIKPVCEIRKDTSRPCGRQCGVAVGAECSYEGAHMVQPSASHFAIFFLINQAAGSIKADGCLS